MNAERKQEFPDWMYQSKDYNYVPDTKFIMPVVLIAFGSFLLLFAAFSHIRTIIVETIY